jgi:hypothetical protein
MSVPYGSYALMAKSSRGWMGGKVKVRQLGIRACETERALGLEDTHRSMIAPGELGPGNHENSERCSSFFATYRYMD